MDIYDGPVGSNQIHDFNPGIAARGLFWTTQVPERSITVASGIGRARWSLDDLRLDDYHDLVNALQHGSPVGTGILDMTMTWSGGGEASRVRDPENGFVGRKVTGISHISFTVEMDGFSYTADESGQTSVVSEVWKERNGTFFS